MYSWKNCLIQKKSVTIKQKFSLRLDPFWEVRKNKTSKKFRHDYSIPLPPWLLDNAKYILFRTSQNGSRLNKPRGDKILLKNFFTKWFSCAKQFSSHCCITIYVFIISLWSTQTWKFWIQSKKLFAINNGWILAKLIDSIDSFVLLMGWNCDWWVIFYDLNHISANLIKRSNYKHYCSNK